MADTKERRIISPEEFSERKNGIEKVKKLIIPYIIICLKEKGNSLEDIASLFEVSADEILQDRELNEIINVQSGTREDLDKLIPEEIRPVFTEIIELPIDGQPLFENEKFKEITQKISDYLKNQSMEFIEELSESDLSQIPPEMYRRLPQLEYLRFEGTGARLDFSQFDYSDTVTGSLKGCELISFNPTHYNRERSVDNDAFKSSTIDADCLDESQYQVVLDGYRYGSYIPVEIFFLFELPEIQENNDWFFEEMLTDEEVSEYKIKEIWKVLTPENQAKRKYLLERIIDRSSRFDDISLLNMLSNTDGSLIDEYEFQIRNIYKTEDGRVSLKDFLKKAFKYYPPVVQVSKFDTIIQELENSKDLSGEPISHDEAIETVWENLRKESQEQLLQRLYGLCINEDKTINTSLLVGIIVRKR